jgi:hypothetical protein
MAAHHVLQVADVWSAAGHISHPDTCVECWLLPCSLTLELQEETPLALEQRRLETLRRAALRIQRWWRHKKLMLYLKASGHAAPAPGMLTIPASCGKLPCYVPAISLLLTGDLSEHIAPAELEHMDSGSTNTAWVPAAGRLGASGLIAVPQSSTKIIDDLIYQKLPPSDRFNVDQMLKQRMCAAPLHVLRDQRELFLLPS